MVAQPPILQGTERQQLMQLRQYLYQISRDLNVSMTNLTAENFAVGSPAQKVLSGEATNEQTQNLKQQISALKSLIIKNADFVQHEMDRIEAELESNYVAVSEFGTFTENIQAQITATAENVSQVIDYQATITDDLASIGNEFDAYVIETNGYIRQGIIGYEDAVPVIGIAIGQDVQVTGTTETVNGKEYSVIDTSSNMSVWTPGKLSFYIHGAEVAYFSNGALYVDVIFVRSRIIGGSDEWEISFDEGFTIKWIGG